ncbi:MAG TPA: hypothetical protein VGG94_06125, partial [Chthoniobacterales bacterium]
MKTNTHPSLGARVTLATLLILGGVAFLSAIPLAGHAAEKTKNAIVAARPNDTGSPNLPGT